MVQELNLGVLPIEFLAMSYMYQLYVSVLFHRMLDNHKQTLRPYCENHMLSILQSIGYMGDN